MSPSIALLKAQHYGEWRPLRERGESAGSVGPYSVDLLEEHGLELRYSDRELEAPWIRPWLDKPLGKLGRKVPEMAGAVNALANRDLIAHADLTLGVFEDQGSFASFMSGRRLPVSPRRMALIVCWIAEWAQHAGPRKLRGYRRVLRRADLVFFFSENQRQIFENLLEVRPERLVAVPFGIDDGFFAGVPEGTEGYVLAVGTDRSRDHATLVEAVRGTDIPTRIYAPVLDVPELPPNVTWIPQMVSHVAYRDALAGARAVAIPTRGTAYPGGQTVMLEAMAAGRPVITTRSDAVLDYVTDGETGLLVEPGDVASLKHAITRLMGDDALRERLTRGGREAVRERFNQRAMWAAIAPHLLALAAA